MKRLFPKTWFSAKDPKTLAQAQVADAVSTQWRAWLSTALSRALGEPVSIENAPAVLAQLDARYMLALDQALRVGHWDMRLGRPARGMVNLTVVDGNVEEIEACLFAAACNANGFIREQALVSFRQFPGRLATAAALIRTDDWVEQVELAGSDLLRRAIAACGAKCLLELADLLIPLSKRQRFWNGSWLELIEPALLDPSGAEARWQATERGSPRARQFALGLVARADQDRLADCCLQAVKDSDPSVARWGISASGSLSKLDVLAVMDIGLSHPHASVRAAALRQHASIDPDGSRQAAEDFLFDFASAPRNAAVFLARNQFHLDPLDRWRAAMVEAPSRRAIAAVMALGDFATPEDAERLVPWLSHPNAPIRVAALRGLVRAQPSDISLLIDHALRDESTRVARLAIQLCSQGSGAIDGSVFRSLYASTRKHRMRQLLVASAQRLEKWEALDVLLDWYRDDDPAMKEFVVRAIQRWTTTESARFTPLRPDVKSAIAGKLAALKGTHPRIQWGRIGYAVESS